MDEIKKAWSGERILQDRVGRAPQRVSCPSLTLCLTLQPGVLETLQNGRSFRIEGVLGRFLWCIPAHGLGRRLTGRDVPALDGEARERYRSLSEELLRAEPQDTREDGTPIPHTLTMDPRALDLLHAFEAEVEADLGDGGRFADIRDWAGKAVGQAVRVAALLELSARAQDRRPLFANPIGPWAMQGAIKTIRALSSHALTVFGELDMDNRTRLLRNVLKRARALVANRSNEPDGVTLRDLWQACRGRREIADMEDLRKVVDALQRAECLRLRERPSSGGRPPSPVLELHPKLRVNEPKRPRSPTGSGLGSASGSSGEADRELTRARGTWDTSKGLPEGGDISPEPLPDLFNTGESTDG